MWLASICIAIPGAVMAPAKASQVVVLVLSRVSNGQDQPPKDKDKKDTIRPPGNAPMGSMMGIVPGIWPGIGGIPASKGVVCTHLCTKSKLATTTKPAKSTPQILAISCSRRQAILYPSREDDREGRLWVRCLHVLFLRVPCHCTIEAPAWLVWPYQVNYVTSSVIYDN